MEDQDARTPAHSQKKDKGFEYASQWQLMWWNFRKHKLAMVAGIVIIIMYLGAMFAEFVAPYDPSIRHRGYNQAPPQRVHFRDENGLSLRPFVYGYTQELDKRTFDRVFIINKQEKHPIRFFVRGDRYKLWGLVETDLHLFGVERGTLFLFGTDKLGRDLFSRIIYGGRISMSVGLVGVFLGLVLGLIVGGISGYYGGVIDNLIQRGMEILRCFPQIPLWMALSAALPDYWTPIQVYFTITIILSVLSWTNLARVTRGFVLSLKNEDFVMAARLSGTSEAMIIARHLIPSFISHIIAVLTLAIPGMILGETALSFLGIGIRPPAISWGVLLQDAQNIHAIAKTPWQIIPIFFVIVFVLAFNFLGDGLRDAADPYAR